MSDDGDGEVNEEDDDEEVHAEDEVEDDQVEGDYDAEKDEDVGNDDCKEKEDDDAHEDDVEEEGRSKDRAHTLCEPVQSKRAWTCQVSFVIMPLHGRIYRKNAVPQDHDPNFARARAVEKRTEMSSKKATSCESLQEKASPQDRDPHFV